MLLIEADRHALDQRWFPEETRCFGSQEEQAVKCSNQPDGAQNCDRNPCRDAYASTTKLQYAEAFH